MKRVYVFQDGTESSGVLMSLGDSKEDFISRISPIFGVPKETIRLYTANGCEILDVDLIRENESIYLTPGKKGVSISQERLEEILSNLTVSAPSSPAATISDWVKLNVGGKHFTTSRATLLSKEPNSMLARMFTNNDDGETYAMNPSITDESGAYLIDRSPQYFEPILNYLRHGRIVLDKNVNPKGVLEEALFYGIESMIPQLNDLVEEANHPSGGLQALTRMDVVRSIVTTPTASELRFQGVNLAGADLSRLDLRNINFKYACLAGCNLSVANLSQCCLERADLSNANMEGAQLLGVKALCANFEGANLKSCNMDDPAGPGVILEGANLKAYLEYYYEEVFKGSETAPVTGSVLEGSNMAGVNLRVATLKNANLKNCDLRGAVLAGANLESCDLSGSDLHEANLRGANLKDAAFELMLTPLHMSQTIR